MPFRSTWALLIFGGVLAAKLPASAEPASGPTARNPSATSTAERPDPTLPPPPDGVIDFSLERLYLSPAGRRGLEFTPEARQLDGKRVRLTGFMVRQTQPVPWCFLLSPISLSLHEREYGLAEDLPPSTLHVFYPRSLPPVLPWERRPVVVTGIFSVGNREEADGRISAARLTIEAVTFGNQPTLGTWTPRTTGSNPLSVPKAPIPAASAGNAPTSINTIP